jgi:uncharacterized membrane protein YeaQ/YmgE (transglycosylase-associated protein family)
MIGAFSWISCGVVAGFFVNHIIAGYDKGLLLLTLCVGAGGAIAGGLIASLFNLGDRSTFSIFALLFAFVGAAVSLVGYRRKIGL